jgi:hypothetical protein
MREDMRRHIERQPDPGDDQAREIPKWARRYAQNRTLPVAVFLVAFALGAGIFGGLSYLIAWAYVHGERLLAGAGMLALCGFLVWWLWFSLVGAGRLVARMSERLYRAEGKVSIGLTAAEAAAGPPSLAVFLFLFCIAASIGLGLLGFLPRRHMQPISAIYVVPFLVYIGRRLRGVGSPLMFLWPVLYGLHAILLVAGAPIRFEGSLEVLNIFLPAVGYGLVAALAGHLYSRVALRRLREAAATPAEAAESGNGGE